MVPLFVENVTTVPAGMAFPFSSTTVTVAVDGMLPPEPRVVHEDNTMEPTWGAGGVIGLGSGTLLSAAEAAASAESEAECEVEKIIT